MNRQPQRPQPPNGVQRIDRFFRPVSHPNRPSLPPYWNERPSNPASSNQQSISLTANSNPDPPMYAKNFRGPGGPRNRQPSNDQLPPVNFSPHSFRQPTSNYGNPRPPRPAQPFNSAFRSPLQANRPNFPILGGGINRPMQSMQRAPTFASNVPRNAVQPPPARLGASGYMMPNPSQRFTPSFQGSRPSQPFPNNSSNASSSNRWDNAGGFFVPDDATSQTNNFSSSAITSQNAFQPPSSTSAFPTAESFYNTRTMSTAFNTGGSLNSTTVSACNPVFDVVDDDEEAGLLAALEEYESTQQEAHLPSTSVALPPVAVSALPTITVASNFNDSVQLLDDDMGDVDWGEIMELENSAKPQQDIQIREQKIRLPPPVVATNFTVAPHYPTFAKKNSTPALRQQTLQEVQPEPIVILDEIPAGTQVPSNIKPLPGFDMEAGMIWLYPTNFPLRDYQYNIVQKALYRNTLVSLPTGLGKTFIAAVIMFNFYRWYPAGKVVFLAPTKPLVSQQHKACYSVMGIPQNDMVEMTGAMNPERRATLWTTKRVFFMTPQTAVNDLENGAFLASDVRCLVIDEAHRATGGYAYVEIVRMITSQNKNFRVLALSATPGNDLAGIQVVLTNLRINCIEIRTDESLDIRQYVHKKVADKVVVQLDPQMRKVCDLMFKIVASYIDQLKKLHALPPHLPPENVSKFQIIQHTREFTAKTSVQGYVKQRTMTYFLTLTSLLHAYELLCNYGLRPFYRFVHETLRDGAPKSGLQRHEMNKNDDFQRLVQTVKDILDEDLTLLGDLDDPANTSGNHLDRPYVYGHPKLRTLETIVLNHFSPNKRYNEVAFEGPSTSKGPPETPFGSGSPTEDSRIMIFTSFRESVHEIAELLRRSEPLVRVMAFIGQASTSANKKGLTQKEQAEVIEKFRSGDYNVLVSTSVGEEGLDIGEVDLIICFDTQKSPIRSVQRTGRTGRKRAGRTIVLLTEGKEENMYKQCLTKKTYAAKTLLSTKYDMFKDIPRMVPDGLKPVCVKLKLDLPAFEDEYLSGKFSRKKSSKGELQTWLRRKVKAKESEKFDHKYLSDAESLEYNKHCKALTEEVPQLPVNNCLLKPRKLLKSLKKLRTKEVQTYGIADPPLSLSNYTAWQIMRQPVSCFRHSSRSDGFVTTMQELENYTAQSSGDREKSLEDDFLKWYKRAERAGYIELDSEDDPGSSSDESDGSRANSPEIPFVPIAPLKRVSKRLTHPARLCSLSTPQPFVPSPEELEPVLSPHKSLLPCLEDVSHEVEGVDMPAVTTETNDEEPFMGVLEAARHDSFKVDCSMLTEDDTLLPQPNKDYPKIDTVEKSPSGGKKVRAGKEQASNKLSQDEIDDITNLQNEHWETWNNEPVSHKQADMTMMSINGALSFINRTTTSPDRVIVHETPLIPTKSSQHRTDHPSGLRLDFSEKKTTEVTSDGVFLSPLQPAMLRINDTFCPSSTGGPLSHSTPRHDRTRRRLMITPDISPVCDRTRTGIKFNTYLNSELNYNQDRLFLPSFSRPISPMAQPKSSQSRVEGSIGDESDLEDLIPCSFADETALRTEEALMEKERQKKEVGFEPSDSLDVEACPLQVEFEEVPPTFPFRVTEELEKGGVEKNSPESISQEVKKMKLADVSGEKVHVERKMDGNEKRVELNKSGGENRKMIAEDSIQCITPEKVEGRKSLLKTSDLNYSYEEVSKILIPRKKTAVAFSPESEEKTPRFARRSSGIGSSRSESALKTPVVVKKRHRNAHQPFKSPLKRPVEAKGETKRVATKKPPLVKPRLRALEFIDDQADVSNDQTLSSDESEGDPDEGASRLMASQSPDQDPSYMRAIYAQALHRQDPTTDEVLGRHRKKTFNHSDIFSQPFVQDEDYGSSSFVAYSDEEDESPVKRKKLARKGGSSKPSVAKGWKHDFQTGPKARRK